MEDTVILVSKDNVSFRVSKRLLLEYSGLFRTLFTNKAESVDNENKDHPDVFHVSEINSDILTLVIDYLKLKDKKQGEMSLSDFPIEPSKILDVMSAALFFDC